MVNSDCWGPLISNQGNAGLSGDFTDSRCQPLPGRVVSFFSPVAASSLFELFSPDPTFCLGWVWIDCPGLSTSPAQTHQQSWVCSKLPLLNSKQRDERPESGADLSHPGTRAILDTLGNHSIYLGRISLQPQPPALCAKGHLVYTGTSNCSQPSAFLCSNMCN